jgi:hypothetical protein
MRPGRHYHDTRIKLVAPTRLELVLADYQSTVLTSCTTGLWLVQSEGYAPSSSGLQPDAMTTSANSANWLRMMGVAPTLSGLL